METHTGKRPNPPEKALVSFQKADLKKKKKEKQLCIQNKRLYTESAFPGLWYCRKQKYRRIDSLS